MNEGEAHPPYETKKGLRIHCPYCKRWRNYNISYMSNGWIECAYCEQLIPSNWEGLLRKETAQEKRQQNIVLFGLLIVLLVLLLMESRIL